LEAYSVNSDQLVLVVAELVYLTRHAVKVHIILLLVIM